LYLRFESQRLQPALDLLQRLHLPEDGVGARVFDLGCGTGTTTRLLQARWPQAQVVGVDRSEEMLEKARGHEDAIPYQLGSADEFRAEPLADLIFSNAALHWLPDHATLIPRLIGQLSTEGKLAVQMPLSWDEPSHRAMRDVLAERRLGEPGLRDQMARPPVDPPLQYDHLLAEHCRQHELWTTTYYQRLPASGDEHPVLSWVRSTGLRPILGGLEDAQRAEFLEHYAAALDTEYPRAEDGGVLYPFPRLFFIAQR
ncbi:MAG: methyltransferase domain-containing protein, partial [Planctomycetes bacterium]|nr:methyltransferase domain-containing protein [Planctomycetota bacterium]